MTGQEQQARWEAIQASRARVAENNRRAQQQVVEAWARLGMEPPALQGPISDEFQGALGAARTGD